MARIFSVIAVILTASCFWELNACLSIGFAAEQTVRLRAVDDQKAVIAMVEPVHERLARARIGGTITTLTVMEGDHVTAGDRIAVIAANNYILRLQLPERHSQFMKAGDAILIGARGLQVQ